MTNKEELIEAAAKKIANFQTEAETKRLEFEEIQYGWLQVLAGIDQTQQKMLTELLEMVFPVWNRDHKIQYFDEWGWPCTDKNNPLPKCVYNETLDPPLDTCLFCGNPHERK